MTSIPRLEAMVAPENSFFSPSVGGRISVATPASALPPVSLGVLGVLTFTEHAVQAIQGMCVAVGTKGCGYGPTRASAAALQGWRHWPVRGRGRHLPVFLWQPQVRVPGGAPQEAFQ